MNHRERTGAGSVPGLVYSWSVPAAVPGGAALFLVWSVPGRSRFVPSSMNRNDAGAVR
ncbi:MAG: hypothetical protein IJH67_06090 [Thermoguttaceae bacterium]|nr:hypothetical protein [Thermoguttaceae bacterium]